MIVFRWAKGSFSISCNFHTFLTMKVCVHSLKIRMKVFSKSSNRQGDHQNVYFIVTNRLNKLPFLIFSAGGWVTNSILSLTRSNNIQNEKLAFCIKPNGKLWFVICMHLCNIVTKNIVYTVFTYKLELYDFIQLYAVA